MEFENTDFDFAHASDLEHDNLDINNIQNEFKSLNLAEYNTNADLLNKIILSSQSACIKTGSSNDCENTIKLNEDDLIDRNDFLKRIFQEFIDKNECIIDQAQGLFATKNSKLSKSIQRKLINLNQLLSQGLSESIPNDLLNLVSSTVTNNETSLLINQSLINQEYKKKLFRLLRSIVERVLIDALSLYDQYINQIQQQELIASQSNSLNSTVSSTLSNTNLNNPTSKLWIEIRNRGCQFLGPQMQDDVLRLTLHALETVNRMSRKVLVLYVVHMLKKHYPKASKTSVGHVIQLLYRAGCFIVEKRDNDSSLMELRKEFMKYPALRRQHDTQIIQIALESGIRMSPEQWSQKLFGDSTHKSDMQSIIDKLQSQQTIEKLIQDFFDKIQTGSQSNFAHQLESHISSLFLGVKSDFDYFASINFEKKNCQNQEKVKKCSGLGEVANSIGSGGESLASEDDDFSFEANDLINICEFSDFESNDSYTDQKQAAPQAKIIWSLLTDCIKRTLKILSTHLDYSTKLMNIIISNQTKNQGLNNKLPVNLRQQMNTTQAQQSPQSNLNINFTSLMLNQNNQKIVLPMGPNSKINNQHMNKQKYLNHTNNINNNNHRMNQNKFRNFADGSNDYRNNNQFGFTSFGSGDLSLGLNSNKIWSDETSSVSSNGSNGFNKNRLDFSSKNNFNNQIDSRKFQEQNIFNHQV